MRFVPDLRTGCFSWAGNCAAAPVAVGENVLNNASLEFGDEGGPLDWNLSYEKVLPGADFIVEGGRNVIRVKPYYGEDDRF